MKILLAILVLCNAQIVVADYDDDDYDNYRMQVAISNVAKIMATMWDNSYTCSLACVELPMQEDSPWNLFVRFPNTETSDIIPVIVTATCDHYAKMKPCLSQCPDGSMKSVMTTLSSPYDTACSEPIRTMIKDNMQCMTYPSLTNIYQQCLKTCPVPDCRGNGSDQKYHFSLPTLLKTCGAEACKFSNCMAQCFANRLVAETKCDPKAVGMMSELVVETARSMVSALAQGGITLKEIPSACQELAKL